MNKKKVSALLIAGVLSIGAIGGTLAWFTSQDSVTNAFQTVGDNNGDIIDNGVEIEEEFDKNNAANVLPGGTVIKEVWVNNTASYDQLIRAKIEKVWKTADEVEVAYYKIVDEQTENSQGQTIDIKKVVYLTKEQKQDGDGAMPLNYDLIKLNLSKYVDANEATKDTRWIQQTDAGLGEDGGYYYYNKIVGPTEDGDKGTKNLLDSVTLLGSLENEKIDGNVYKNLKFEVIVTAESVQATNGAVSETWTSAPETIKTLGNKK